MFLDWLRRAARAAVLQGINDAVKELAGDKPDAEDVQLMLPGPAEAQEEEQPRVRRKG